jgi:hypothetical protein
MGMAKAMALGELYLGLRDTFERMRKDCKNKTRQHLLYCGFSVHGTHKHRDSCVCACSNVRGELIAGRQHLARLQMLANAIRIRGRRDIGVLCQCHMIPHIPISSGLFPRSAVCVVCGPGYV